MELHHLIMAVLAVTVQIVGVTVWLIRQEGKINMLFSKHESCDKRCDERTGVTRDMVKDVGADLSAASTSLFALVGDLDKIVHRLEGYVDAQSKRP